MHKFACKMNMIDLSCYYQWQAILAGHFRMHFCHALLLHSVKMRGMLKNTDLATTL